MLTIPYTYLIGWPEYNRWYYGVRYKQGCHPNDFWIDYFTSSFTVKDFVTKHGDPTIKIIRKTFNNITKARLWESKVLRRLKVVNKDTWLNKNDRMAPPILAGDMNPMRDPIIARKSGDAKKAKGIKKTDEWKANHSAIMTGKKHSTKSVEKRRKAMLAFGENHHAKTPKFRLARSQNMLVNNPSKKFKKICSYCNQEISIGNYVRWHGVSCKLNPLNVNMIPRKNPSKLCECCQKLIGVNAHKLHQIACFNRYNKITSPL
jgi:hypothetical protein